MAWVTLFGWAMLAYLFFGYPWLLAAVRQVRGRRAPFADDPSLAPSVWPELTVLITVHNEAANIVARITNVLACDYLADRLEVLVASDGSTDDTDRLVAEYGDPRVRLFRPLQRRGKTDTQNQAIAGARGSVVVFTDADTRFAPEFLRAIASPFADPQVGGVDGHLLFESDEPSPVGKGQGFYWAQELRIRRLESELGILAVGSGACLAVRRELFRPMLGSVGEDCLVPLDVVSQGWRMIHAEKALAFDRMDSTPRREFRTRVRMTLRNWQGTWAYPHLLDPTRNPGIAFALWSHKVLRWLSPLFLAIWLLGSGTLVAAGGSAAWLGLPGVGFALAGLLGLLRLPLPGASLAYGFFLANAGFAVGVGKALAGQRITAYK